jgi:hypothetical protein
VSAPTTLAALDEILNRGGDADDVLRAVVEFLAARQGISWASISFREQGRLVAGPEAGEAARAGRIRRPVVYRGEEVGELAVEGDVDGDLLGRVATAIAPYVLLGWDTGGEAWEP